jgi:hypothetical protein
MFSWWRQSSRVVGNSGRIVDSFTQLYSTPVSARETIDSRGGRRIAGSRRLPAD